MKEIYQREIKEIYQEYKTSEKGLKSYVAKSLLRENGKKLENLL